MWHVECKEDFMPRAIWKGTIAFGLVNIPVSLYSADTRPDIQLHMVDSRDRARVRYERVNAETGEEVPWDAMVKGFEYEKGHYVLLSEEEMEAVKPKLSKTVSIDDFVSLEEIDPLLFDKPYFLEPDKRGQRAYALLRSTLKETGKAGIAKVVIRTREYLTAVFVRGEVIVMMLLRFPQELQSAAKLDLPDDKAQEPKKREVELAAQLVESMTVKWEPERYHDDYRQALMEYIEKKVQSGETAADVSEGKDDEEEESDSGNVVDLMDYLKRSVEGAGKKPVAKKAAKKTPTTKKNATKTAKKVVAKKAAKAKTKRSA